ncbi:MAG: aldo/keto reductase [Phycisphaerae bacterium]|nr:aldo/keto reductase [Phycisphaerae bacterium]
MQYTRLGNTGLHVSRLCLGMMTYGAKKWRPWVLEETESRPFIEKALECGINFFDTADVYSNGVSEEITGRAIKELVPDREDVVIATKCFNGTLDRKLNRWGLSRKHIMNACDQSLKRLGTEYIDLYQIHRLDDQTPMEEMLEALHDLVKVGKVRYIGASSMYAWQFAKCLYLADKHGFTRFVSMQNHYNLIYREEEREMMPLLAEEKIGCIPWSPLARGFLAGNRHREGGGETERAKTDDFAGKMYFQDSDFTVADRNVEVAKKLGVKPMQVALAWVLSNPVVDSPIIGASKIHHLDDAIGALDVKLSAEDKQALEASYQPHPVLGFS